MSPLAEQLAVQKAHRSEKAEVLECLSELFMERVASGNEELKQEQNGVDAWLRTFTKGMREPHISA